jgi:hypothetical protein
LSRPWWKFVDWWWHFQCIERFWGLIMGNGVEDAGMRGTHESRFWQTFPDWKSNMSNRRPTGQVEFGRMTMMTGAFIISYTYSHIMSYSYILNFRVIFHPKKTSLTSLGRFTQFTQWLGW